MTWVAAVALGCSACNDGAMTELHPGEPVIETWTSMSDSDFREFLVSRIGSDGCRLVLVDGGSASAKTTFAARVASLLEGVVVHTDDVAWHLHPTDWDGELLEGVIAPWRQGREVSFRPPGWIAKEREGALHVPVSTQVLVVEGVGAGRATLAKDADLVVWVQADRVEARRRGIIRDIEFGREPVEAERFWDEWMESEEPFLAADQPWTRADLIVNGTCVGDDVQVFHQIG